jgi:hypothetical protein
LITHLENQLDQDLTTQLALCPNLSVLDFGKTENFDAELISKLNLKVATFAVQDSLEIIDTLNYSTIVNTFVMTVDLE